MRVDFGSLACWELTRDVLKAAYLLGLSVIGER
jgi:hypothetical protein